MSHLHHRAVGPSAVAHVVESNEQLSADIHRITVHAPRIAGVARPGQFVIVRLGDGAERIPLTIAERLDETIVLVVQAVGKSTRDLVALAPGDVVRDVVGPLGRPSELVATGSAVCVAGGVGAAVMFPIARELVELGVEVTTVLGARTAGSLVYTDRFAAIGDVVVCTDDGSAGHRGVVTEGLADVLTAPRDAVVYTAGPVAMMRAVAELTRALGIRTIASLNPIMVDGTGMCGGCRVTVGGEMRFACVDGPEFDAHLVDFDELADRLGTYRALECRSLARSAGSEQ